MALNWAVGENSHKAEDPEILDSSAREIIWFDILDFLNFLSNRQTLWLIDPNNLNRRQEEKVANAKSHFESGGWMDPSDIQGLVCDRLARATADDDRIMLEGRNRLVAAIQLGETYAPFSVPRELVDELKSTIVVRSV